MRHLPRILVRLHSPSTTGIRLSGLNERLVAALADRYRIERELGAGGMATVYLAHDLKHERKVAIKVLKPELAAVIGAERFLAEIRTTANLQHPHILPLFDSGAVEGSVFYAMPYVEGESLRERLARVKQLPVADAVRIAGEVASALDYAHRHGVIHRDIKPENILLQDGSALIADFGIALAASRSEGSARLTETGMSLGTPHYMSPEQAMGERTLDARTDIYALGCVLYEMLAGEPPFTGPTAQAILARVMTAEPDALSTLRRTVPLHVADAVHTAIQKLPADRFESANAFAGALQGDAFARGLARAAGSSTPGRLPLSRNRPALVLGVVATLATAAAVWSGFTVREPANPSVFARFALALPKGQEVTGPPGSRIAFAPDGRSFVYVGPGTPRHRLWVRRLSELDATPLAGSDGATNPVFSPDGSQIAFTTLTPFSLRVVAATGGQARILPVDSMSGGGLYWAPDGYIYFDAGHGVSRIRPDGSGLDPLFRLDASAGESGFAWPQVLPDERGLVVRVRRSSDALSDYAISAFDLRTRTRKHLVQGLAARYSPSGHLLWVTADGALHAQLFDPNSLDLIGQPAVLWKGLAVGGFGSIDLALSPTGDLLYTSGAIASSIAGLVWVDRGGRNTPIDTATIDGFTSAMSISPSGEQIALELQRSSNGVPLTRIWVKRLGGPTQLVSTEGASSQNPAWSRDGRDLFYNANIGGHVMRRRADGSGTAVRLFTEPLGVAQLAVSPDGKSVVLATGTAGAPDDLRLFRIGTDRVSVPLVATSAVESSPAISPDGRWLAYTSDESGRPEVYVRPFPDIDRQKVQVSVDGGSGPRWHPRGGELFFLSAGDDLMAVRYTADATFTVRGAQRLFNTFAYLSNGQHTIYDVAPDGRRFLMANVRGPRADNEEGRLILVQNVQAELRRRLPR